MRLSKYCNENCIIQYALPANETHLIQPADVSVFKPLKSKWKNTVYEWATHPENVKIALSESTFFSLFQNLPVTISNSSVDVDFIHAIQTYWNIQNYLERHQKIDTKNAESLHPHQECRICRCQN